MIHPSARIAFVGEAAEQMWIKTDSLFSKYHMLLEKMIKLTYYRVYKYPGELVGHELPIASNHTTVD